MCHQCSQKYKCIFWMKVSEGLPPLASSAAPVLSVLWPVWTSRQLLELQGGGGFIQRQAASLWDDSIYPSANGPEVRGRRSLTSPPCPFYPVSSRGRAGEATGVDYALAASQHTHTHVTGSCPTPRAARRPAPPRRMKHSCTRLHVRSRLHRVLLTSA